MSYRARIDSAAKQILAADEWDKRLALAHLLGELGGIGRFCDYRQYSPETLANDIAAATERTAEMLKVGKAK